MRSCKPALVFLLLVPLAFGKDEGSANELVKQHLASIGNESARGAVKSRVAEGTLQFRLLGSGGAQDGKAVCVFEGNKLVSLLKLPNPSYHGERFVSDGKSVLISTIAPGTYSVLGGFLQSHPEILTEGLWGGTLSTGWALANLEQHQAQIQDKGIKKVDGIELRQLHYAAKHSDLEITIYFEKASGRHVMTTYSLTISPRIALSDTATARQQETRYLLEERFSDFRQDDGVWLPHGWTIHFTSDVPVNPSRANTALARTAVSEFVVTLNSVQHNVPLDSKNFVVK